MLRDLLLRYEVVTTTRVHKKLDLLANPSGLHHALEYCLVYDLLAVDDIQIPFHHLIFTVKECHFGNLGCARHSDVGYTISFSFVVEHVLHDLCFHSGLMLREPNLICPTFVLHNGFHVNSDDLLVPVSV